MVEVEGIVGWYDVLVCCGDEFFVGVEVVWFGVFWNVVDLVVVVFLVG